MSRRSGVPVHWFQFAKSWEAGAEHVTVGEQPPPGRGAGEPARTAVWPPRGGTAGEHEFARFPLPQDKTQKNLSFSRRRRRRAANQRRNSRCEGWRGLPQQQRERRGRGRGPEAPVRGRARSHPLAQRRRRRRAGAGCPGRGHRAGRRGARRWCRSSSPPGPTRAVSTRILGKTMRDAVRNKER